MHTNTDPQSAVEIPLYTCHKQVRAAKITGILHKHTNPKSLKT